MPQPKSKWGLIAWPLDLEPDADSCKLLATIQSGDSSIPMRGRSFPDIPITGQYILDTMIMSSKGAYRESWKFCYDSCENSLEMLQIFKTVMRNETVFNNMMTRIIWCLMKVIVENMRMSIYFFIFYSTFIYEYFGRDPKMRKPDDTYFFKLFIMNSTIKCRWTFNTATDITMHVMPRITLSCFFSQKLSKIEWRRR